MKRILVDVAIGLFVAVVAGVVVAWIIQDARFVPTPTAAPVAESVESATTQERESTLVVPSATLPPSPIPPTPTATPDLRLFWDDFEMGIKPEWGMSGRGFAASNGSFVVQNGLGESQVIGDSSWQDYAVRLGGFFFNPDERIWFLIRVQDRDNYMALECFDYYRGGWEPACEWHKVVNGRDEVVPGTHTDRIPLDRGDDDFFTIEVQGNIYRTFVNGEQKARFADNTFTGGGFAIRFDAESLRVGSIEIVELR